MFKYSTTTKLRVVFDASSKSPNGNSLKDCFLLGPRLQDHVFDILIRLRLHQYALSADVAKMYRQVALDKSDRDFHRILWRDYVTDEIRELRMTCVTYGVASSFYHSTRALHESAKTNGPNPNTVNVILNVFWVDDLISGADTLEEACVLQDDLIETLNKNCLPLRKWSSNQPQPVTRLPKDLQEADKAYEINDKTHPIKTLILTWHPLEDHFVYASRSEYVSTITKRTLLCDVSKHFDPIGLIAPVLVVAKVIIQSCWKLDLEWNDAVPHDVSRAYTNWKADMGSLSQLKIPRKVLPTPCTLKHPCKSSVMPRKKHMVPVFIWCQSKMTSSPQPSSPPNARWLQSNPQLSHDSSSWQFTLVPNLEQQSRKHYQNQSTH